MVSITTLGREFFPGAKIDKCEEKFNKVIANTSLFISGWNSTTYLETMLSNIPTVLFWKPEYFELRHDAQEIFEKLKKVKILHNNPTSALKHVRKIWKDIDKWWCHPDVLTVKNEFTNKYVNSNNSLFKFSGILKNISNRNDFK